MIARPAWARVRAAAAGAGAGATVWLSRGTLGLVDADAMTRVAALPGWPWLAASVAVGAGVGALALPPMALVPLALLTLLWLPWLPTAVPGAFLMWEGPLEGVVWAAAVGGVVWLARPRAVDAAVARWFTPSRATVAAALVPAVMFGAAWMAARARVPAGDEPHYLVITQSLLRDGDLRIENNHRDNQYLEYFDGGLRPDFMQRGTDGHIYSIHAPGLAVLVAPAFALAGYPGAVATVVAVMSLCLALVWRAAYLVTGSASGAWMGWGAAAASAPVALHGFMVYPDPVGAAAVMCGVLALVWLELRKSPEPGWIAWLAIGAALAWLPWLHTRFALVAGVLGAAIALRLLGRRGGRTSLAAFLALPAVAASGWFLYFWRIYGTLSPAAPYGARPEGGLAFIPAGLVGLVTDQQFGFGANAPVLLVAVAALVPLVRRHRRLGLELVAVLVPYLLTVSAYPMWWGGYSPPARFAVVVLPMLGVPLALWWAQGARTTRAVMVALTLISATITIGLVTVEGGVFVHNSRDGYDLLLGWLSQTVDLTLAAPSVHRDGAGVALADFAAWLAAGALMAALWTWRSTVAPTRWTTRVLGALAVPAAVLLAVPVVWAARDGEVLTPSTSQMAFLDRWSPEALPVAFQLRPSRRLVSADVPRRLNLGTSHRGARRPGAEPLLQIPELPAGEYDLFIDGESPLAGEVTVRLGRQDVSMETWSLADRAPGFPGLVLRLPVSAHSITMAGNSEARGAVGRLTLKPRAVLPARTHEMAVRAARYGSVVVFGLDDHAYLEAGALWVQGGNTARLVVRADEGSEAVIALRAGPVPNQVTVTSGAWSTRVDLAPEQSQTVRLPPEALSPSVLSVSSASGFRPSEYAAGNRDVRRLGVHVTWPETQR